MSDLLAIYNQESDLPFDISQLVDDNVGSVFQTLPIITRGGATPQPMRTCTRGAERAVSPPAINKGGVKYRPIERDDFGGYDGGCEAGFTGVWVPVRFEKLKSALNSCKQAADDGEVDKSYISLGGFVWQVSSKGAGTGGALYKWVLEHHGTKLYIHSNPRGAIAGVRVRFGAQTLYQTDLFSAVRTLKYILNKIGFEVESETISRVDLQIMLPVPITDFLEAMQGNKVVTQCRGKMCIYTDLSSGRTESITFKSSTQELCIYDKIAEVCNKDAVGYTQFRRYVLGGRSFPSALTRVEFRFRRDILKRYGITTFADLERSQQSLITIASSDWFRILENDKIRGHENNQACCKLWKKVQQSFNFWFSGDRYKRRKPSDLKDYEPHKDAPKVSQLLKQAMGVLGAVAAYRLPDCNNIAEVFRFCHKQLKIYSSRLFYTALTRHVEFNLLKGYNVDGQVRYSTEDDFTILTQIENRDYKLALIGGEEV